MGFFDDNEEYQRELRERKARSAALLGKWITVLFWLQIASVVVGVLNGKLFEGVPMIQMIGSWANYGIVFANSIILIKLKTVEDWLGKAGICYLVSTILGILVVLLQLGGALAIPSMLAIAMMIVQMRGNYSECTGYEVVLRGLDDDLAGKWERQWKLEIICTVTVLVSSVVLLVGTLSGGGVLTVLAGFVTLVASIGAIVLGILRLVYLYRTATRFQNYVPDADVE